MASIVTFFGRKFPIPQSSSPDYEKDKVANLVLLRDYGKLAYESFGLTSSELVEFFEQELADVLPVLRYQNSWIKINDTTRWKSIPLREGENIEISVSETKVVIKNYLGKGSVQVFNCI